MTPNELFNQIAEQVERLKPELLQEWRSLEHRPFIDGGDFLNKHFPIEGGWMRISIIDVPSLLKDWTPK